jgi:hypothetical protein
MTFSAKGGSVTKENNKGGGGGGLIKMSFDQNTDSSQIKVDVSRGSLISTY